MGIDAFIHRRHYHYVPDYYGRSAHKHIDIRSEPIFGELARTVIAERKTLLYYDRLYTVFQALTYLSTLRQPLDDTLYLAEVGVFKGGTSYFIASVLEQLQLSSHTELHCFDTFEGHASEDVYSTEDPFHQPGMFSETQYQSVQAYLKGFGNVILHQGRFQETCANVAEHSFAFVHLDVDLFEVTRAGLAFFDQRLISGGIIIVDDYGFRTCPGVKKAVDQFTQTHHNYAPFHLLTGQCLLMKTCLEK